MPSVRSRWASTPLNPGTAAAQASSWCGAASRIGAMPAAGWRWCRMTRHIRRMARVL